MKIVKGKHKYYAISWYDLPEKVKGDFDYLENDQKMDERFIKYKGYYYDSYDMMGCNGIVDMGDWDAYHGESYFSGILLKYSHVDDCYRMASYYA